MKVILRDSELSYDLIGIFIKRDASRLNMNKQNVFILSRHITRHISINNVIVILKCEGSGV